MKKNTCAVLALTAALIISACPADAGGNAGNNTNDNSGASVKTGRVTFFNESSYSIVVHLDSFSGVELAALSAGQSKTLNVRASDNHGIGTTFSIEYLYRVSDGFDTDSGTVIASGIDPNVQINFVVEENKSYTKQIPQPANLEFQTAFVKILNASSLPFELRHLGTAFKQTGNGNLSVATGKTGVYKLEGIPSAGKLIEDYQIVANFANTAIPNFTVKGGFIYNFTYNGSTAAKTGEQAIIFK